MTQTFFWFTSPPSPVFSLGAPFLLAAALMAICVILHVAGSRARRTRAP